MYHFLLTCLYRIFFAVDGCISACLYLFILHFTSSFYDIFLINSDEWWEHHRSFSTGDNRKRGFHPGSTSSDDNYPYIYRASSNPNASPNPGPSSGPSPSPGASRLSNRSTLRPSSPPTCHHRAVRLYRRITQSSGVILNADVLVALLAAIVRSGVPNVPELAGTTPS